MERVDSGKRIPSKKMSKYLRPTKLCDSKNPLIVGKAIELKSEERKILGREPTKKEMAMKIYLFVRDEIKFGSDLFSRKASETLMRKVGQCIHKTNLQVALCRAVKIPARYHLVEVPWSTFKDYYPPWQIKSLEKKKNPKGFGFPFCEVFLEGRWIACQALYDIDLDPERAVGWDGEHDVIVFLEDIKRDLGSFDSIDRMIKKVESRGIGKLISYWNVYEINRYINAIRRRQQAMVRFVKE